MRPSGGTAALLIGACAVGGLAGCTRDSVEPTPAPTVSSSPTATPSPTPTPTTPPEAIAPERPAAMDEISVDGAEAAATYFLQLYPYVYATRDLAEWSILSDPECIFCASVISNVEAQQESGTVNRGSLINLQEIEAREITRGSWFGVNATFVEGPSTELDQAGAVVSERAESTLNTVEFALTVKDGAWTVREVEVLESVPAEGV